MVARCGARVMPMICPIYSIMGLPKAKATHGWVQNHTTLGLHAGAVCRIRRSQHSPGHTRGTSRGTGRDSSTGLAAHIPAGCGVQVLEYFTWCPGDWFAGGRETETLGQHVRWQAIIVLVILYVCLPYIHIY